MVGVANEDDVGDIVGKHMVGCFQCALFLSLRKNDALLVSFGARTISSNKLILIRFILCCYISD